jgi:hypothetical protein
VKLVAELRKDVALCSTAGVAFVDGGPQRCELQLVLLFLTLQGPQRGENPSLAFS